MGKSKQNLDFFEFTFQSAVISKLTNTEIVSLCVFFPKIIIDTYNTAGILSDYFLKYELESNIDNGVVNSCVIILPECEQNRKFTKHDDFTNVYAKRRRSYLIHHIDIIFLFFDKDGNWNSNDNQKIVAELVTEIKTFGLYNIFDSGDGILGEEPAHHYVLQNNFHSNKFIRTANILSKSFFIDFISLFLLEFVKDTTETIYIDTSGIISIPYSITKLKRLFEINFDIGIISFNSYKGPFPDSNSYNIKILISASTSGKLSNKLINNGHKEEDIAILFFLSDHIANCKILCDLADFQKFDSKKYSPFVIKSESECVLCPKASYPIKIAGEQFLPEELKVEPISFLLKDKPLWLNNFMELNFHKKNLIQCYKKFGNEGADIFLDYEKMLNAKFKNSTTEKQFLSYIDEKLPKKIDVIIYYDEPGSAFLKDIIVKRINYSVKIILKDFELNQNKNLLTEKNILVITATCTTGKRLIDTSLKLREVQSNHIAYFIGISRTPDNESLKKIKSYISFNNNSRKEKYPVNIFEEIFVDDTSRISTFSGFAKSTWASEMTLLKNLNTDNILINDRLKELEKGSGFSDNLFWGDSENVNLKLRPNFAFFKDLNDLYNKTEKTSQSEIYFIVSAILHKLRTESNGKYFQSAFHRNIISPQIFFQYNDGVIHASILRAANPIELNYNFQGLNTPISNEMILRLGNIFNDFDTQFGEATIEFLIAIASMRLQLNNSGLKLLIENLISNVNRSLCKNKPVILLLCNFITKHIYHG